MSLLDQLRNRPALRKTNIDHDASAPSLIDSVEITKKYDQAVIQANIENWSNILEPFTPRTIFVPISQEDAKLLLKAYENLEKREDVVEEAAATYVQTGRFSSPLNAEEQALLDSLGSRIQQGIQELGGGADGCFMKLSSRSPKDAAVRSGVFEQYYRDAILDPDGKPKLLDENDQIRILCEAEGSALRFRDAQSVIRALVLSERVWQDLTLAFRHPEEWGMNVVLRQWEPVSIHLEFRTFIHDNRMTAISQYAYQVFSPQLNEPAYLAAAVKAIQSLFGTSLGPVLSSNGFTDYVLDFGVVPPQSPSADWRATLIEINPFEETTDGALFQWNTERDILEGKREGVSYPLVRVTERPRPGSMSMIPKGWKRIISKVQDSVQTSL